MPGSPHGAAPPEGDANRKNMIVLIQLRWVAILGQLVTIGVARFLLGVDLPLAPMAVVLTALVGFNVLNLIWLRRADAVTPQALLLCLVLDVAFLTAQLWLSGGALNPFAALYLLQVTLAAILLDSSPTWVIAGLACTCFAVLSASHRPLDLPVPPGGGLPPLYLTGVLVCFALNASLLVVFLARIAGNLRQRDARLALLRQRALEEDHIVRMGLLAASAAHELGTPLASLSVILGDWQDMPLIADDEDLSHDLEAMQSALARCKTILSGVLMAAGEARGEGPLRTSVHAFLDGVAAEWRAANGGVELRYENLFAPDMPIVTDLALKKIVFNVLDNAAEAPSDRVMLTARRMDDALLLQIADEGPGFAADMLERFGRPYASTKGRSGGGLGLFLVVNVMRKLGGRVSARNKPAGGAIVELSLPLSALSIGRA